MDISHQLYDRSHYNLKINCSNCRELTFCNKHLSVINSRYHAYLCISSFYQMNKIIILGLVSILKLKKLLLEYLQIFACTNIYVAL